MGFNGYGTRFLLNPDAQVRSGPFIARIGDMVRYGWEFDTENRYHSRGDFIIMGRNPRYGGMVFYSRVSERHMTFLHVNGACWFYFPPDCIIESQMHRAIEMPEIEFMQMDVGMVHPDPRFDHGYVSEERRKIILYDGKPDDQPDQLIVMPDDVNELMDQILKVQKPRQQEILASERKREEMSELHLKAKILTFG